MKTKIYALIFVLLIAFVGYTLYNKKVQERNAHKDKDFKVENFKKVTKIDILERNGNEISLKRVDDTWIVNDKFPVNMHLFKDVQEALENMKAISPVAKVATESVVSEMIKHAIKVSIYEGKDDPEKVIYIGGPNLSNTASHMFIEYDGVPSKKIYEVGMPGFRGYLTTRFLASEADWRSKEIFNYEPIEFKAIEFKYFTNEDKTDFVLSKRKENYSLSFNETNYSDEQLDKENVINYILKLRDNKVFEYSFEKPTDKAMKDSLLREYKFAELKITNVDNEVNAMTLVDMPVNEGSTILFDENGDPMRIDVDYKYIIFGAKEDWGIISNANFGLLFLDPVKFVKQ